MAAMTSAIRPYYSSDGASAAHYDLITGADRSLDGDIDIYAGLAPEGGSILELGTGTGRIAIPLAERGFTVTGVDIAPTMLAQAEARQAALPAEVAARLRFVRGDMRSLALGSSYDAVIATFFTLAHIQPLIAWKPAFARVARHLKPGGRFAAHLPDAAKLGQAAPPSGSLLFQTPMADGEMLTLIFVDQQISAKTGRFDLTLDYVVTAANGTEIRRSRERYTLFDGDPLPFATRVGLVPVGTPITLGNSGAIHMFEKVGD